MKKVIETKNAPGAIGPYSQAIKLENLVFTSGQLPINSVTGVMPEGIEAQTVEALENVKAILEEAGSGMDKVIKTTVFLSDMNDFNSMNKVYKQYFVEKYPARSTIQVARLPKDAKVEIEVIAYN